MAMGNEGYDRESLARMMGPGAIDTSLRECIRTCWMMMPDQKRTIDDVEAEIRRLVDRAFKDLREDQNTYGM